MSGGKIGDSALGTKFVLNGSNRGIIAAIGPINFSKRPSGHLYENVGAAPGNPNAAAIRAIFTDGGVLLALDLTNLDLLGLARIIEDLLALKVGPGGNLTGPTI